MKSAMVEREAGDAAAERGLLAEGIRRAVASYREEKAAGKARGV